MNIEKETMEGVQNVRQESAISPVSPVIPETITDEIYNSSLPMDVFVDIMAEIDNANDEAREGEIRQVLMNTPAHCVTSNDPTTSTTFQQNISISPGLGSTSTAGQGLTQELARNMGVVNPILISENFPNSSLPTLLQNSTNLWPARPNEWYQPSGIGMNSTTVELPNDAPPVGSSFGNSMFPNTTTNSVPRLSVLPYGGGSSNSHQQVRRYHHFEMTGLSPVGTPAMTANTWASHVPMMLQHNQRHFFPRPPSLTDFQDFVPAWEGCLVGKIHYNRASLNLAKAFRRPTSPATLTLQWSSSLEIALFLPRKAVNYTMRICEGPIDYMFVHITQFNNLDLYDHLMSRNLCAKIVLPSQTLILSTTASKYHYLGIVFTGDTVFVEPMHVSLESQSIPNT